MEVAALKGLAEREPERRDERPRQNRPNSLFCGLGVRTLFSKCNLGKGAKPVTCSCLRSLVKHDNYVGRRRVQHEVSDGQIGLAVFVQVCCT